MENYLMHEYFNSLEKKLLSSFWAFNGCNIYSNVKPIFEVFEVLTSFDAFSSGINFIM